MLGAVGAWSVGDPRCPQIPQSIKCETDNTVMDLTNLDWTHWSCCSNEDMKNKFLELQSQENNCESCGICLAPTELTATTTSTQSPAPPQCRNFWNDQFCTFLKAISRAELNDNRCLTTDPGMTAFIRAHCYKKCCRCKSNRCPDVTEQTLWGRKFKLKHALKIFKGISSNKS